VVLTFLITLGGIGLAEAAGLVSSLQRAGHSPPSSYETTLLVFAFLSLAASLIVMVVRQLLARRGLMPPLSVAADRPAGSAGGARAGTGAGRR